MKIDRSNKSFYQAFCFVIKATDNFNEYTKSIKILGNKVFATDRRRLHVIESNSFQLENGVYEVEKTKTGFELIKKEVDKFYDIEKIIHINEDDYTTFSITKKLEDYFISEVYYYISKYNIRSNYKYIKDFFDKKDCILKVNIKDNMSMFILENNFDDIKKTAYIMPYNGA